MTLPENRALCVQMMNECAAAVRVTRDARAKVLMKCKLAELVEHAESQDWLPECFSVSPDLQL